MSADVRTDVVACWQDYIAYIYERASHTERRAICASQHSYVMIGAVHGTIYFLRCVGQRKKIEQ